MVNGPIAILSVALAGMRVDPMSVVIIRLFLELDPQTVRSVVMVTAAYPTRLVFTR